MKLKFPERKLHWFGLLNAFLSQMQGCAPVIGNCPYFVHLHRDKTQALFNLILNLKRSPVIIDNVIQ